MAPATTATWTVTVATQSTLTIKTPDGQTITQTLPAAANPSADQTTAIDQAKAQQTKTQSGCSYQSIHARQMAVAGFRLADSYCSDFFNRKRVIQNGNNVISDFASGATSLAGAIAGLVTGSPAAPSAIGGLVGVTNQATALTNKDFLFGSDNIDTVWGLTSNALQADTKNVLPEPDVSDWNYNLSVATIRNHQEICNPANIVALIKQSV
jgi:hypothetical protein